MQKYNNLCQKVYLFLPKHMEEHSDSIYSKARQLKIEDFTYELPDRRIAKYPLGKRDASKLLVWQNGAISQSTFNNLATFLPEGSMLVFNNTKVIRARLLFYKTTGAKIEIFCLEPNTPSDYQIAFQQTSSVEWKCIAGNAKKWKEGTLHKTITIDNQQVTLSASQVEKTGNDFIIRFSWNQPFAFSEIIEHAGVIPIPPYLNRETEKSDIARYQTIFARIKGSVAAPTAALHFTDAVTQSLLDKNILMEELTLHVGAGTFQPVKSEKMEGHDMHSEVVSLSKKLVKNLIEHKAKVIATGTTSVRSLESIYWLGIKLAGTNPPPGNLHISQWEPYKTTCPITTERALQNVLQYMDKHALDFLNFTTQIIIAPGYEFKIIDGMLTNFHQPKSTLLLLIAAFLGNQWKEVYKFALKNNFRFLSYGDSNLYLR